MSSDEEEQPPKVPPDPNDRPVVQDFRKLERLPVPEKHYYYHTITPCQKPENLGFVDKEFRTIYERCLHPDETPIFSEAQVEEERDILFFLSTILSEGSFPLAVLLKALNHYRRRTAKPGFSMEEFDQFIKMRSHFFTVWDHKWVENTTFGVRRYFPSVICFMAACYLQGARINDLKRYFVGLPAEGDPQYAGEVNYGEYFWKGWPHNQKIQQFFESHPDLFSLHEIETAYRSDESDPEFIVSLIEDVWRVPSLWDSKIFLKMKLPDEDRSLSELLHGKIGASQKLWGTSQTYDAVASRAYFRAELINVKNISEELPCAAPNVLMAHRTYNQAVPFIATHVTKVEKKDSDIRIAAEAEPPEWTEYDGQREEEKQRAVTGFRRRNKKSRREQQKQIKKRKENKGPVNAK